MKTLTMLLSLVLVMCMAVTLCACGDNAAQDDTQATTTTVQTTVTTTAPTEAAASYEVTVLDQNGAPVQGVMVQICKDMCVPKVTDANGVAVFDLEITDGYKLSVLSCPTGYAYKGEAEVYLESGSTSFTVEVEKEA